MDATDKAEERVRGVRRGRPPKSETVVGVDTVEAMGTDTVSASQAYAERIWVGQSPDLPVSERVSRIHAALTAQGMDTNVTLPQL